MAQPPMIQATEEKIVPFFPISHGTSFGLQGAFGIDEKGAGVTTPAPLLGYGALVINVRTLIRNWHSNQEKDTKARPDLAQLAFNGIVTDATVIQSACQEYVKKPVVFYGLTYRSLGHTFPNASFKVPATELQKDYADFENALFDKVMAEGKQVGIPTVADDMLVPNPLNVAKALVWTHLPVDLLSLNEYKEAALLESHTGVVKTKAEFNTKIALPKDAIERLPFNRVTLQVYGDKGSFFSPLPAKVRQGLVDLAFASKWTSQTTMERMKFSLQHQKDEVLKHTVMPLF